MDVHAPLREARRDLHRLVALGNGGQLDPDTFKALTRRLGAELDLIELAANGEAPPARVLPSNTLLRALPADALEVHGHLTAIDGGRA